MNWNDLKIVLAISRNRTQSAAAEVLGMDQSTVGRRLNAIEASLGTVLFVRSNMGFQPTEAGQRVLDRAKKIETQVLWLEDEAQSSADTLHGPVTIIGNHWTLDAIIGAGLEDLLIQTPGLELRFVSGSAHWPLTQGRPELALWFEIEPKDAEFAFPISEVAYALYIRKGRDPDVADWVSFEDPRAKRAPDRWLRKRTRTIAREALDANDAGLLLTAIEAGIGKGLLPCCIGDRAKDLVRIDCGRPALVRTLHAHASTDLVQTRRLQCVIHWLQTHAPRIFADPKGTSG
ncbi:LysR family transcriptional regulator [Yoonia sp. BS5-3]|uniref:LysR family transcriptional regulator n=1 Tax=Yoonia phaeophyticola TaxID=3137369 RepID=A0ABZ2V9P2_9RHOB